MNSFDNGTPKVGLALSGGALRGIAHIGVLKALEEEAIPVDMIAGTSAGAFMGACFAKSGSVARLQEVVSRIGWRKVAGLFDLNLMSLGKGFIHGRKIKSILHSCIGDVEFEDLEIPFAAVAADCQTLEEVVISKGSVIEAVRSSISVPVIFTPVKWSDRFLIDGGVVNPLPVDIVRNMGAEIVVAVNVATVPEPRKNGEYSSAARSKISTGRGKIDRETPNIFNVLTRIIRATECERMQSAIKAADIVISPDLSHMETSGLSRVDEAIMRGYRAAKAMLPQLQAIIYHPSLELLTCTA